MIDRDDETPPLHPIHVEHIPNLSWVPASIELLPDGWVNVRIYSYDRILDRELYTTDTCPAILHLESNITERMLQYADEDGELFHPEYGEPYDSKPVLLGIDVADPPHKWHHHLGPDWKPAYRDGGYLESCPREMVREVLVRHGFADAIEKPEGWRDPDDEAGGD